MEDTKNFDFNEPDQVLPTARWTGAHKIWRPTEAYKHIPGINDIKDRDLVYEMMDEHRKDPKIPQIQAITNGRNLEPEMIRVWGSSYKDHLWFSDVSKYDSMDGLDPNDEFSIMNSPDGPIIDRSLVFPLFIALKDKFIAAGDALWWFIPEDSKTQSTRLYFDNVFKMQGSRVCPVHRTHPEEMKQRMHRYLGKAVTSGRTGDYIKVAFCKMKLEPIFNAALYDVMPTIQGQPFLDDVFRSFYGRMHFSYTNDANNVHSFDLSLRSTANQFVHLRAGNPHALGDDAKSIKIRLYKALNSRGFYDVEANIVKLYFSELSTTDAINRDRQVNNNSLMYTASLSARGFNTIKRAECFTDSNPNLPRANHFITWLRDAVKELGYDPKKIPGKEQFEIRFYYTASTGRTVINDITRIYPVSVNRRDAKYLYPDRVRQQWEMVKNDINALKCPHVRSEINFLSYSDLGIQIPDDLGRLYDDDYFMLTELSIFLL